MALSLGLATVFIVVVTLLPLWRHPHWLVRGLDFPRLQFSVLASMLLLAQLAFLNFDTIAAWLLVSVTLLCLGRQLWWILPYTAVWNKEVHDAVDVSKDHRLSIITANVLTTNRNADAFIRLVEQYQPDVVVTLESDHWWQAQLDILQTAMPYTVKCPLDNLYGMHVYSRLPLLEPEVSFLVQEDVPSIHTLLQLRSGDWVRVHFLHPAPPSPTENPESAQRDAELVIVARSVADSEWPVIVTGDLNDVAWSATTRLFRKLSGLLDPRVGRGLFNTFHAQYPFLRWPLDHIFHSSQFSVCALRRLPDIGSDHFALFAELAMTSCQQAGHDGLSAERADHAWAKSISDEQDVSGGDVPRPGEE